MKVLRRELVRKLKALFARNYAYIVIYGSGCRNFREKPELFLCITITSFMVLCYIFVKNNFLCKKISECDNIKKN